MQDKVEKHYSTDPFLKARIAKALEDAGRNLDRLTTADLASIDEFHVRGRQATLELAERLHLSPASRMLDLGSGLGGPARTVAQTFGCHVTGIDLTASFCDAADAMSGWTGLAERTRFQQGDATDLPYNDAVFDVAMTLHVAMNIAAKDQFYREARRVLKPGSMFGIYDILAGDGDPIYPAPWARTPEISHLATPAEMRRLLTCAGFEIQDIVDSTDAGHRFFLARAEAVARNGPPSLTFKKIFDDASRESFKNLSQNLAERRVLAMMYICRA